MPDCVPASGKPIAGQMCIEAAVCFALGLPHGDEPPCVGKAVREFKIKLNDCNWSSNAARAKGMRKLAIAQLGSDVIDQVRFAELLALKTIQRIVPKAMRVAAAVRGNEKHKAAMEKSARRLRAGEGFGGRKNAADAAAYAAPTPPTPAAAYCRRRLRTPTPPTPPPPTAANAAANAADAAADAAANAANAANAADAAANCRRQRRRQRRRRPRRRRRRQRRQRRMAYAHG